MAAQAYSPSDAMSQADICLGGTQKVQSFPDKGGRLNEACPATVAFRGGVVHQIIPPAGGPVSLEGDADPFLLAPDDVAWPLQLF